MSVFFSDVGLVKIFFPFCRLLFCLLTVSFSLQKLFSFTRSCLLIVDLSAYAIGALFRKLSPVPMHSRVFLIFSSIMFSVSGFMLRSLIHLDSSFVQGNRYGSICIFIHADIQLCQHQLLKMFSFVHCIMLASLLNIRCP